MRLPDYHTHTARCGHAVAAAEEYVRAAMDKGLAAIGISDHLPLLPDPDPTISMDIGELGAYVEEVLELKKTYPGFVLLGIEADYRPHTLAEVNALLQTYPFDYVIGSVHHLGAWGIDDERQIDEYSGRDVDAVWVEYLELVGDAAESGLFTILGHLDLAKKFGFRPSRVLAAELDRLVERVAKTGVLVEINTAGLHKPVGEAYPAPDILRRLCAAGVNITFGSDAHRPSEVGRDFRLAVQLAIDAGYTMFASLDPQRTGSRAHVTLAPLAR
jgi:histidinol-phosphatase (PHP family)